MLNAQQVEAEIFPLLFGAQVQNGTATYKRGPNIVNPKHPGTDIDVIRTTGNVQQGIIFADKQKESIEANTGVNQPFFRLFHSLKSSFVLSEFQNFIGNPKISRQTFCLSRQRWL